MYIRYVLALLCAILFFVQPVSAEKPERDCSGAETANGHDNLIVFINGILNTRPQAYCALEVLRDLVDVNAQESDFELFYNPTNGLAQDILELRAQAEISDRAHDIAQNDSTILVRGTSARYNFVLGKIYVDRLEADVYKNAAEREVYIRTYALYTYLKEQVEQGKSITVVAHSQGNFYIEAAIAIMQYRGENEIAARIRVVGVAPVSSTTPNGIYFSLEGDRAIGLHRNRSSDLRFFTVLPPNARGCVGKLLPNACQDVAKLSDIEWMTHGFVRVYLSPNILVDGISVRTRIKDQVVRSRDILTERSSVESLHKLEVTQAGSAMNKGDCRAFFWVRSVRKPGLDGRYYLVLETLEISTSEFLKTYFVWSVDGRKTTTWPASYDGSISGGQHTIRLEKHVSKTEVYVYTRTIDVSKNTPVGQTSCPH
jgi:hypothetical protein